MVRSFSLHECPAEIPNDSTRGKRSRFHDYQSKSSVTFTLFQLGHFCSVYQLPLPPDFHLRKSDSTFWKGVLIPLDTKIPQENQTYLLYPETRCQKMRWVWASLSHLLREPDRKALLVREEGVARNNHGAH